jgi:hypothetical protein
VLLLEIVEDEDGDDCYVPIEDEQKLDKVWDEFERLYNEEEEDDEEGDGCGCDDCNCEDCGQDEDEDEEE